MNAGPLSFSDIQKKGPRCPSPGALRVGRQKQLSCFILSGKALIDVDNAPAQIGVCDGCRSHGVEHLLCGHPPFQQ